jgi:hypothetical protein
LKGFNHGRQDDLESLAYTYLQLFDYLPWKDAEDNDEIIYKKEKFLRTEDESDIILTKLVRDLIRLAHSQSFDSPPNYLQFKLLLSDYLDVKLEDSLYLRSPYSSFSPPLHHQFNNLQISQYVEDN